MAPPDAQNIPPHGPEAPAPAAERAEGEEEIHAGTHAALQELRDFIQEENIDFSFDRVPVVIQKGLQAFLESNKNIGPENFQKEWRRELLVKLKERMRAEDEPGGAITKEEAEQLLAEIKDPNKGVGSFEQWFQKNHPAEYQKWQVEKAAAAAQQKALDAKKKELGGKAAALEPRLIALPENIAAATLAQLRDLKGKIAQDDGKNLEAYEKSLADLGGKIPELEAQVKREADAKQSAEAAAQEAAEEADAPFLDRLNTTVAGMEEGKWKTIATKLAAALTGLFVMLSKAPLIGGWVRRNFISNKTLASLGDKNAEIAVRAEGEFRKFGLTGALANELGGKKTKDVVVLINDPQKLANLTTDTAVQQKLTHLAGELTNKGGATSEVILFEFMGNNPAWTGVQYGATAVAAAPVGTPPASQETAPPPAETPQVKLDTVFAGMTADDRTALEDAKAKDVASGTLPDRLKSDERAIKIATKLKANGADRITDPNRTVKQFVEGNLDKDWTIA